MGRFFSDRTEEGIQLVWMQFEKTEILRGIQLLKEEADGGDADAMYFYARCLMGSGYVWEYAGVEPDRRSAERLVKESARRGSVCGIIGSMRSGDMTPAIRQEMPFPSLKAAWDQLLKKAGEGHPFCQYIVGNAYYYGDIIEIEEIEVDKIDDFNSFEHDMAAKCIPFFEAAVRGGLTFAGRNLCSLYREGKHGFEENPDKIREWTLYCAQQGDPDWECRYADLLAEEEKVEAAMKWYESAGAKGDMQALYCAGFYHYYGRKGVPVDRKLALKQFREAAEGGNDGGEYEFARMLFYGEEISQDYEEAAHYLRLASAQDYERAYPLMGVCYLKGLGVTIDFERAKRFFEHSEKSAISMNGLGEIYADGLGVSADIKKGVEYFQKAAADGSEDAKKNLERFKKTLFGKWVKR